MIVHYTRIPVLARLCLIALLVYSTACADDASQDLEAKYPALRDEILVRVERDQEARRIAIAWSAEHGVNGIVDDESLSEEEKAERDGLWAEVADIDTTNTQWLKDIVGQKGWPKYSDVGIDGGNAAWLLVQHADADPLFQRTCLDLMSELPGSEVSQANMALLTDRVYLREGKKQIYGTQFSVRDGEWVPRDIEDEDNVDARRASVGLPPLAEYKEMLEAVMRGEEIE